MRFAKNVMLVLLAAIVITGLVICGGSEKAQKVR